MEKGERENEDRIDKHPAVLGFLNHSPNNGLEYSEKENGWDQKKLPQYRKLEQICEDILQ